MTRSQAHTSGGGGAEVGAGGRRSSAILITGAGGEVGHGLIRALSERASASGGAGVVAMDIRDLDPALKGLCREVFVGDICDSGLLGRMLAMYEITEIYHLAALLSTRGEFTPEVAHHVNVTGTMNLLQLAVEQARSHGRKVKFFYPSSIAAYGVPDLATKQRAGAVKEDQFLTPTTMYGINKLYGEHLGRYYSKHYRQLATDRMRDVLDFRCIRYPGLISAETMPSGGTSDYAPEMVHAAASGKAYQCFVREDTRIPFMVMEEAIEATLAIMEADGKPLTRQVYNIGSFSPSAGEVAALVREFFPKAQITFAPDTARQGIVDTWPAEVDDSAARKDWGFKTRFTAKSAFAEVLVPRIRARYG